MQPIALSVRDVISMQMVEPIRVSKTDPLWLGALWTEGRARMP